MVLVRLVKCLGGERRSELNLRKWISSFQDPCRVKENRWDRRENKTYLEYDGPQVGNNLQAITHGANSEH